MYYMIYVSQAARPMTSSELTAILEKSRMHNERDGLSGLLIYKFMPYYCPGPSPRTRY